MSTHFIYGRVGLPGEELPEPLRGLELGLDGLAVERGHHIGRDDAVRRVHHVA